MLNENYKKKIFCYIFLLYKALIYINFFVFKFFNIKFTHNKSMGFGDGALYFFINYRKIKKRKIKTLNFSNITLKSSKFYFGRDNSISILPKIPKRIYYQIMSNLLKEPNPFPYSIIFDYGPKQIVNCKNLKYSFRRLVNCKISKNYNNNKLKLNYICIHIKHYNNNHNEISGASLRQVSNFDKIEILLSYLLKKKIAIVILNSEEDRYAYEKFKNIKSKIDKDNLIYFVKDIFPNFTFENQCALAINSIGYVGTDGGPSFLYTLLRKKTYVFDTFKRSKHLKIHKNYKSKFNFYVDYKFMIYNNRKFTLSDKLINFMINHKIKDFEIKDINYSELKNRMDNIFFNKANNHTR